jgi:Flp pilus assembly pilin Flp
MGMTRRVFAFVGSRFAARNGRRGQALVEYALILSFVSVLTIAVMSLLGVQIRFVFEPIIDALIAARQSIGG